MSKVWRSVSAATPVGDTVKLPDTDALKVPSPATPKKNDSLLPVEPHPHWPLVAVYWKSQTTRVVVFGAMPVLMYCVPEDSMYSSSVYPSGSVPAAYPLAAPSATAAQTTPHTSFLTMFIWILQLVFGYVNGMGRRLIRQLPAESLWFQPSLVRILPYPPESVNRRGRGALGRLGHTDLLRSTTFAVSERRSREQIRTNQ